MNRSASAAYYPFQVMPRFLLGRQGEVYYIGGSDILPPPLETQREARILEKLGTPEEKEAKSTLIEHNLRLVVYIRIRGQAVCDTGTDKRCVLGH